MVFLKLKQVLGGSILFLTVGEKLREIRKEYKLKQLDFVDYGFSRNYISMIETNQRNLNNEKLSHLYQVLCELTNDQVKHKYSFELFSLNPTEQAIRWLEQMCTLEYGLNHYDKYTEVIHHYKQLEYGIRIEEILAKYYGEQLNYVRAYDHYLRAISYSLQASKNPAHLYELAGVSLFKLGKYSEAIFQFKLALNCLINEEDNLIFKVKYDIAICYFYEEKYQEGLDIIDDVINQDNDLPLKGLGYLLKESLLKRLLRAEEGRQVLNEFISSCFYEPHLGKAYHNLGCNYKDEGLYEEALEALHAALSHHNNDHDVLLTRTLIGLVHFELKHFALSEQIFNQIRPKVLMVAYNDQKQTIFEWAINLYWELGKINEISMLMEELRQYVRTGQIDESITILIQNHVYKKIMRHMLGDSKNLNQYQKILNDLRSWH